MEHVISWSPGTTGFPRCKSPQNIPGSLYFVVVNPHKTYLVHLKKKRINFCSVNVVADCVLIFTRM